MIEFFDFLASTPQISTALIGALGTVTAAYLAAKRAIETKKEKQAVRQAVNAEVQEAARGAFEEKLSPDELVYLVSAITTSRKAEPELDRLVTRKELKQQVEDDVTELKDRLKRVESRLPSEGSLDKLASVNDAILATKLEWLEASLARLEHKLVGLHGMWPRLSSLFSLLSPVCLHWYSRCSKFWATASLSWILLRQDRRETSQSTYCRLPPKIATRD